jgi:hypothetical protein
VGVAVVAIVLRHGQAGVQIVQSKLKF